MKTRKFLYLLPLAALVACEPDIEEFETSNGTADFSRTVSVGNSLTAGYQSNALRRDKQMVSFPAMLAEQFVKVGGGEFKQPLLEDGVGVGAAQNAEFGVFLTPDCLGETGPSPKPIAAAGQADQFNPATFIGAEGPYNNVGVPGAKSFHLVAAGYGNPNGISTGQANPYYSRFINPTNFNKTVLATALEVNPTFFTLFIGNNDILSFATTGGSGDANPGTNPASYGPNDITDPAVFQMIYSQLVNSLTANGAKGAVANIPDVTSIPFFTTIKWNALVLTQAQADQLNAGFGVYNAGLDNPGIVAQIGATEAASRKISFSAGANGFVTIDKDLSNARTGVGANDTLPKYRQLKKGELVTLSAPGDAIKCQGLGSANTTIGPNPLPDNLVLDEAEITAVANATAAYNTTIKTLAAEKGLAFVDANAKLKELATTGIVVNGVSFNSSFIAGGAFSLDGVHPSTRGYAIIANEFIKAINSTYNASVPQVDVSSYNAIEVNY